MSILCAIIKVVGKLLIGLAYVVLKIASFSFKLVGCMFLFLFHVFMILVDMGTPS